MYDAKLYDEQKSNELKTHCIEDKSYYNKIESENLFNVKLSYIPIESVNNEYK